MFKKRKVLWSLGLGLFLLFSLVIVNSKAIQGVAEKGNEVYQQIKLLGEVFVLVRDNYVEPVEPKELIYGACEGMVNKLDPFSQFMDPAAHRMMKSETEGKFGGLGIRIAIQEGRLTVVTPLPRTPAYELGILPGDKIIKIEDKDTKDITLSEAVKLLRGKPGTQVTISIFREGEKDLIDFTITRAIVKIESVPDAKMLTDRIGYIELTEFSKDTADEFDKVWKKLKKQGMGSLILDLRYNPGGLLTTAVDICKNFIGDRKLIVYTQGRHEEQVIKFFAEKKAKHEKIPLVILVNKGSASGSEIVAGCVQDWKRGIVLGEKTFGKASVQSLMPLSDGSGLRLTTAKYYTPSGRLIHDVGITPDIVVEVPRETMAELMKQREKIYGLSQEAEKEKEKEKIKDPQIERAKEILLAQERFSEIEEGVEEILEGVEEGAQKEEEK
ncbi:MAG: S41 family peptidase [Elusimicrobiota bacterium]|nr:S41 family peptidase [Elusimicrobiota bacterium]